MDARWNRHHLPCQLEAEYAARGKQELFDRLKTSLMGQQPQTPYRQLGVDVGMSEGAVKVALHRMRRRFREVLYAEVAETVDGPDAIEDEIQYLMRALGS